MSDDPNRSKRKSGIKHMNVYTITLERISTGERSPSLLFRGATEADAQCYAEGVIADNRDLRVGKIEARY